ncbi:MAG TPA: RagB/SusD family nutrient uptake outer membrane protein, partial [Parasegetibacter sp.]
TYNTANNNIIKVYNTAFNVPTYYLRLAEMYLIKAEGLARTPSATLDEAKEPLERIRQRAFGVPTPSAATTKEELLEEIYLEIIKELSFENGADWFAAIRFNKIMTIKPTVNNVNKYILPIPDAEILSNTEFGPQNPGYEQ